MNNHLTGIPVLTSKGKGAIRTAPRNLSQKCVYSLVSVDGRRDFDELRVKLRFVTDFDHIFLALLQGGFIEITFSNKVALKNIVKKRLGAHDAVLFLEQINHLFEEHGEYLVNNLEKLEHMVSLYCDKAVANDLLNEFEEVASRNLSVIHS